MIDLTFEVPPGLGDITWCYQKIFDLLGPERNVSFKICGDKPHRGSDFVDTLPGITNLGYGRSYVLTKREIVPYKSDLSKLDSGTYAISLNPWLEAGRQIDKAYPFQKAKYHFQTRITPEQFDRAECFLNLASGEGFKIGFYCSSYAHRKDLGFWSVDEWVHFLKMIQDLYPTAKFVALGAKYDDRTFDVYTRAVLAGLNVTSTLGIANVAVTKQIIAGLDYFFAFPSGLGIIADVVDTPCTMWYWSNLIPENEKFPNSYADPINVESGRHINLPYLKVLPSIDYFVKHGAQHVGTAPTTRIK